MKEPLFKIGFEFEGMSSRSDYLKISLFCNKNNIEMGSDGSIREYYPSYKDEIFNKIKILNDCGDLVTFELRGEGLIFKDTEINKAKTLFKKLVKMGLLVNSSCGLHIHFSLKNYEDYYKFYCWDFVKKFQEGLINDIFKMDYERERFNNIYCKLYNDKTEFLKDSKKQLFYLRKGEIGNIRYRSINFNSFNYHQTIEIRIFPSTIDEGRFNTYLDYVVKSIKEELKTPQKITPIKKILKDSEIKTPIIKLKLEDLKPCVISI